jgi:hypothetical protein
MPHELPRHVGDAMLAEIGERAARLMFYENEGGIFFWRFEGGVA